MNNHNSDFHFSNLERVKAKKLLDGWYWYKYDVESGCLKAPDNKEYMIYDLSTNEYKEKRDSSYIFSYIELYMEIIRE